MGTHSSSAGYGTIGIKGKSVSAHRAAYEIYIGNIPKDDLSAHGWCVCHTCDERLCVNPDHLFLGTNQDNLDDMIRKGRSMRGAKNPKSKINEKVAMEIYNDPRVHRKIADDYNVSGTLVSLIKSKQRWAHLHE